MPGHRLEPEFLDPYPSFPLALSELSFLLGTKGRTQGLSPQVVVVRVECRTAQKGLAPGECPQVSPWLPVPPFAQKLPESRLGRKASE